jgi:holo-[acyl-carrier protein] synthase
MIGLGTDVVQISSFLEQIQDRASQFVQETFTTNEIGYSNSQVSGRPHQHLAVRYAAKEAFIKAWSSCNRGAPPKILSPNYKEIEVCKDGFGRPFIKLKGVLAGLCQLESMQVSLSHDGNYAIATVIVER